jgi:uncharacterized protein
MLRLSVHAHPGARQNRAELLPDGTLAVWVRARAVDGRANAALEGVIADALGLRPRQVSLIAGHSARRKIVEIDVTDQDALRSRFVAYGLRSA